MAKMAYIYENNELVKVHADSLGEKDIDKKYYCCGKCVYGHYAGAECREPIKLIIQNNRHYFGIVNGHHKKGCNESEEGNTKRVLSLNRGCTEISDEDLLERLSDNPRDGNGKRGGAGKTSDGPQKPAVDEDDDDDVDGPIERVKRFPKNVGEIYELLEEFSVYDSFAGKQVSSWIVDNRTFNDYYRDGLEDGQIAVAVMRKYPPDKIPDDIKTLAAADNNYIFICSKVPSVKDSDPVMFFLVPKESATQFYGENGKQSTKFAVMAKWRPVEGIAHVYRPETPLGENHVHPIPKNAK